jgi:thiosulfate reductase / polysulfide reductase chain A
MQLCPLVHPMFLHDSILTGKPYPIKALITSGRNQILADQDAKKVEKALKSVEFSVTLDLFMTPSSELSDFVLPAASWLEKEGLRGHPSYPFVTPIQHKAIEPLFERWDDVKFFTELGHKMKLDIPWKNEREYTDYRLKSRGITMKELDGINFLTMPKEYDRYTKGKFQFNTPSKKVELYSTFLEKMGYDPLPSYSPPPQTTSEFPLIMTSHKMKEYVHSTWRQIESLRKMAPDPLLEINPLTAKAAGIMDGDWVWVESIYFKDKERVKFKAKYIENFPTQVISVEHGWWFPERRDPQHGGFESNINVIIPDNVYDPMYGCTAMKGIPCRVYSVSLKSA